jgi:hypothetical protein
MKKINLLDPVLTERLACIHRQTAHVEDLRFRKYDHTIDFMCRIHDYDHDPFDFGTTISFFCDDEKRIFCFVWRLNNKWKWSYMVDGWHSPDYYKISGFSKLITAIALKSPILEPLQHDNQTT